ncbi:MAG: hypothetical protein GY765_15980, partial [bacterium]|nr:hypothetical protein [bacterium]
MTEKHINADWKLKLGNFLFKHRSFTPIPLILLVFVFFTPINMGTQNILVALAGLCISLLGEFIRILAVGFSYEGTSGRESYLRAENLNVTGIYSILRNPLYVGNFFIFAGIVLVFANLYALLVFSLFLILQYYFVILAEENYLLTQYGDRYREYCRQVRRLLPVFTRYIKNRNPFSLQKVVFKENDSLFNLLLI